MSAKRIQAGTVEEFEEFEEGYASRSGMTVERLHALGLQGEALHLRRG